MAALDVAGSNPLLSSVKSQGLQVSLHPMVLFNISDCIARHILRRVSVPIVGGLLGQHVGQFITVELAIDCHVIADTTVTGGFLLDEPKLSRIQEQIKQVHKNQPLDLVGWWTLMASSGPSPAVLPIHHQMLAIAEPAVLLGFHPTHALGLSVGDKLPLTLYESVHELDDGHAGEADGDDQKMADFSPHGTSRLRFSEVPYSIETTQAEMISMDTIARAGTSANAANVAPAISSDMAETSSRINSTIPDDAATQLRAADAAQRQSPKHYEVPLTRQEEEMIAMLTTRANAIKMMHARVRLLIVYLQSLPPDDTVSAGTDVVMADYPAPTAAASPVYSHSVLRRIQALVGRLTLLVPADAFAFCNEIQHEENDGGLVELVQQLVQSVHAVTRVSKKFSVVEYGRQHSSRHGFSGITS